MNIILMRPAKLIILSGGIAINQPERLARIVVQIKNVLKKRLKVYPVPEIRLSKYGEEIGLCGALALIKKHQIRLVN